MSAVLFLEDWKKFPDAIIDTKTSNQSFVRLASLYKSMGVRNHAFPLALLNPKLQGVDPHDPNLPLETVAMIALECKQNFFFFIREVVRVPGQAGSPAVPLTANRGNIALFWLFFNHIMTILIQIRQTGKSLNADILMRYLMNIRCTSTHINLLTKDDDLRSKNMTRMKDVESELPYYFRLRGKNDIANTEELSIKALGNSYKGILPQRSVKMALNVGRGFTSPIFQGDEVAFLPNIEISLPAALAAGGAARDIARRNGEPYGTVLTTTAGKKDDKDGRFIYNFVESCAVWTEAFFDAKDEADLEEMVRKNASGGVPRVNCTFNHRQLGYTDEWLKRTLEDAVVSGDAADRDYFNVWTSGSQLSPLPIALMEKIRNSKADDFFAEISSPYGYVTRWFLKEHEIESHMQKGFFVMTLDTSDAVGGDDIGMHLRDIQDGGVIAAGNFNETNLITFCEWLVSWFVRFDNFVLIAERRSTGGMILDYLILMLVAKGIDPFKRIYNTVVQNHEEFPDRFKEIDRAMYARDRDVYVKYKRYFGFATSAAGATSRTELYSTSLTNSAKNTGDKVRDLKTINQILELEIRNGRVDHPDGAHDDMAICWVIGYWFLSEGRKLDFYGINPKHVLSSMKLAQIKDFKEAYSHNEQLQLRQQIDALVEQIKKTKDAALTQKLEMRLRFLSGKLQLEDSEIFSVNTLIEELRKQKSLQSLNNKNFGNFYNRSQGIYANR